MITSELITTDHRSRKAIIYIRQSTPQQVLSNQESLRLQYALKQRALELGWREADIEIIDADLGLTGASAQHREGFKEVVAQVTLGQVGLILSADVTRLSRNCSDWYPLLDICGYRRCLIGDRDGIYDPASANGRLLLGLKGQLSELELHTIRARMTAGLLNKAERGELSLPLPAGLMRDAAGRVQKTPNREVQARLELVFKTFLDRRSASQVLEFFNRHHLRLPRHDRFGDLIWKKPTVAAIISILKNPAYAGAFVYGRTRTIREPSGQVRQVRLPMAEWKIVVRDTYPAYIAWETFEKIQAMLEDNYAEYDRHKSRGVPRPGAALLHGLVYCGECGHKMVVEYKGGTRYLCNYHRQTHRAPICQNIPGDPVDAVIVTAFLAALSPVELDAYERVLIAQQAVDQQLHQAHQHQLERLRYEAALAERQFNRVDPDNRLVAAELEKRWETALVTLKQAEAVDPAQARPPDPLRTLPPDLKAALTAVGQNLPHLWDHPLLARQTKKALLRALIDKVVVHRPTPEIVHTRLIWRGGEVSTFQVQVPVGAFTDLAGAQTMTQIILDLSTAGQTDAAIADHLTQLGYRSPMKTWVLPSTVQIIRLKHRLFQKRSQSHPRQIPGSLTIPQIARALTISPHWIYHRINIGQIQIVKDPTTGLYLFPDEPQTLDRFKQFQQGLLNNLDFSGGHQHV